MLELRTDYIEGLDTNKLREAIGLAKQTAPCRQLLRAETAAKAAQNNLNPCDSQANPLSKQ